MTDFTTCPKCGSELPADAPGGICPRCLMLAGLIIQAESGDEVSGSAYARTTPQPGSFVAPGLDLLAPHFPQLELGALLGQGGMGAVYKARQTKLDRTVALKIIRPESASDSAFAERFNREARTLARLSHPQIVGVHDFGEVKLPDPADPSAPPVTLYYFLMEYVDGVNLRQLMEAGDLTPEKTLSVISQICDALQFAHDEGIVHRDIKPENVLLDRKGRVKIADFGLAKLASRSEQDFTLTGTHQVMGTPRYMAPEQMAGSRAVDHRADIYSLGVVFYEMLTGESPAGHFSPPSKFASIDPRLDDVVMKALAQKPDDRFQSVSEIRSSVETISRGESGTLLSKPEQASARGFSTIFEREVGAAWNWVVHPEQSKRDSGRPETATFPRFLFLALAVLGGLTIFLPWAEIRIDQDTVVTSIERGARLTAAVDQPIPATEVWSSAAAGGTCFLLLIVLILIPHRRSPGLIASGVLTLCSLAAFIHTLAYQSELPSSGSVTLPLEVRGQDAVRFEASAAAATSERQVIDSEEIASKVHTYSQKVSLKFFPDRVTYREGFYASLGLSLSLLFFSIISVRNAITNRAPEKESSESWSGTPLASLRFAVPAKGELGTKIKFHFSGLGYELVDEQPGAWIFQRGSAKGLLFWGTNLLTLPTRLSVYAIDDENGGHLVNCHWSVRLGGGFATSKESRKLEDEGRQLQVLLGGQIDNPADASVSEMRFGTQGDSAEETDVLPRDESQPVEDRTALDLVTVEEEVSGPAIAMIVVGLLTILTTAGGFILFGYAPGWLCLPGVLVGVAMIVGGLCLRRFGSRGWAQLGVIAGFLPVSPAVVFTMFVSVLAMKALSKPQVKLAFLERARRQRELISLEAVASQSSDSAESSAEIDLIAIEDEVSGPAIAMIAVGLLTLIGLASADVMILSNGSDPLLVWLSIPGLLVGLGMLMGGLNMKRLSSRSVAQMGAIAGMIPIHPAWILTLPICLWANSVLRRPHVRRGFLLARARQRQHEWWSGESNLRRKPVKSPLLLFLFFLLTAVMLTGARLALKEPTTPPVRKPPVPPVDRAPEPPVDAGRPFDPVDGPSEFEIHNAALRGDLKKIKQFLDAGIDINDRDSEGKTPLMLAAADEAHLVALLMLGGADETLRDNDGKSALMHAVEAGHSSTVKLLIDMEKANWDEDFQFRLKRIDPESTKTLDFKSLHFEGGQNWQDKTGETSLMKAAARGDLVMFDTLRLWSDESLRDLQGRTAIVHAIEQRQVEFLTKLLERAEQYLSVRTPGHNFPVTVTPEILSLPDNSRRTPLDIAEEMELNEVAARIRSYLQAVVDVLSREIDATERVSVVKFLLIERGRAFRGLGDDEQAEADLKRSREIGEREK